MIRFHDNDIKESEITKKASTDIRYIQIIIILTEQRTRAQPSSQRIATYWYVIRLDVRRIRYLQGSTQHYQHEFKHVFM